VFDQKDFTPGSENVPDHTLPEERKNQPAKRVIKGTFIFQGGHTHHARASDW